MGVLSFRTPAVAGLSSRWRAGVPVSAMDRFSWWIVKINRHIVD
jgi:hypothetical protein